MDTNPRRMEELISRISSSQFNSLSADDKWSLLQEAHIASQPFWKQHTWVHVQMFILSLKTLRIFEVLVQSFFTVVAAPSSALKAYPKDHPGTMTVPFRKN
jgi:hypothetical protein